MKRILLTYVLIIIFLLTCSYVFAEEDVCIKDGILVKNLTFDDLWYQKEQGLCTIWKQKKIFIIKPGEAIRIFSDMICKTAYCGSSTFYDYKSFDTDGNCRIRILPGCNITDM